ncbi:hypothetical protein P4S73_25155 [Paraglaciecola sp. Hal342]
MQQLDALAVNIQAVRQKDAVIAKVRTSEFWQAPSIDDLEWARLELRGIMKYWKPGVTGVLHNAINQTIDGKIHESDREAKIIGANEVLVYRRRLKGILDEMISANPTLQKIHDGQPVNESELQSLTSTILTSHPRR